MTLRDFLIGLACYVGAWGLAAFWKRADRPAACSRGHRDFYHLDSAWRCRQCQRAASRRRLKRRREGAA